MDIIFSDMFRVYDQCQDNFLYTLSSSNGSDKEFLNIVNSEIFIIVSDRCSKCKIMDEYEIL
jgi:hypothetical protein